MLRATGGWLVLGSSGALGGSWVVESRVISPLIWVISIPTLLTTPLLNNHWP